MNLSEKFVSDARSDHPVWIVHRIPQPNVETSMRTLQQELRRIPLARSTFFAWAWNKPTLRVPIVTGRVDGTGGKGRVKSLTLDDLMWEFARDVPAGLWVQNELLAGLEGWTASQLIIRAALKRAVRMWYEKFPLVEGEPRAFTDLELLQMHAPVVIPAAAAHEVLTLATVMG